MLALGGRFETGAFYSGHDQTVLGLTVRDRATSSASTVTPGNDLYVVYTHNWVNDPLLDRFGTLDRRAASKVL